MKSSAANYEIPAGFTFTTELEGVDGQSGQSGSGRTAPIEVTDGVCSTNCWVYSPSKFPPLERFIISHLEKVSTISSPVCSVCHEPIHDFADVSILLEYRLSEYTDCIPESSGLCTVSVLELLMSSRDASQVPRAGLSLKSTFDEHRWRRFEASYSKRRPLSILL